MNRLSPNLWESIKYCHKYIYLIFHIGFDAKDNNEFNLHDLCKNYLVSSHLNK